MKKKSIIRMGPGASSLILLFVMLSLSVLAMLALTGGYNDRQMSRRSLQVTEEIYTLYEDAERTRAEIGEMLAVCREEAGNEAEYLQKAAASIRELTPVSAQRKDEEGNLLNAESVLLGAEEENGMDNVISIEEKNGVYMVAWEEKDGVYTLSCAVVLDEFEAKNDNAVVLDEFEAKNDNAVVLDEFGTMNENTVAWVRHILLADRAQVEDDWDEWN